MLEQSKTCEAICIFKWCGRAAPYSVSHIDLDSCSTDVPAARNQGVEIHFSMSEKKIH